MSAKKSKSKKVAKVHIPAAQLPASFSYETRCLYRAMKAAQLVHYMLDEAKVNNQEVRNSVIHLVGSLREPFCQSIEGDAVQDMA